MIGKLLGAGLGYLLHPLVAIPGALLGHLFDKGLQQSTTLSDNDPATAFYFESTFQVLGHIAHVGERITPLHHNTLTAIMTRLRLSPSARATALTFFNAGRTPSFNLTATLRRLYELFGTRKDLLYFFVDIQIELAQADGVLTTAEKAVLAHICAELHLNIEDIIGTQEQASTKTQTSPATPPNEVAQAYHLLGCQPDTPQQDLKRAFRRLIAQHHPDKRAAQGLPPELMELAKQKTQDLIKAYEIVCQHRGVR